MKYEKVWYWVASHLPKKLIYFATIMLAAETTTGEYSNTSVPELTVMDAIKRFSDKHNI